MKKICLFFSLISIVFLSGCLDTTQETTFNEDGSGLIKNSTDMSTLIGLLKQMGGNDAVSQLEEKTLDSTFALTKMIDSSLLLTAEEKMLISQGSMHVKMDIKAEKFINTMILPFSQPGDIPGLNRISEKLMKEVVEKQMGKMPELGMEDMPPTTSIEDYFTVDYSKGVIVKTLNKEKYSTAAADQYLKAMKEAAAMGIPMAATYILNLPVPAKKVEGKNIKISKDKKQVIVKTSIDDFFDDPAKFEFKIEY